MGNGDIISEEKAREAVAQCTKHAKHARYFNEAPSGAKQYIALVFYETVFPNDLSEEVSEQCFKEVLQELNTDDLLYLIAHEKDARTRDTFVERLAFLREESVLQKQSAEKPQAVRERPPAKRPAKEPSVSDPPVVVNRSWGPVPVYAFSYDARRLDREVAVWNSRWRAVCVSLFILLSMALACGLICLAVHMKLLHIRW
jgi:hypothetical protein